eukprot:g28515.t1
MLAVPGRNLPGSVILASASETRALAVRPDRQKHRPLLLRTEVGVERGRTLQPAIGAGSVRVVSRHSSDLPEVLQDSALPPSGRLQHLNTLKMSCYLVTQLATAFEDQQYKQELADVGPSGKARKVKPKSGSFDWESERPRVLQALTHLLQLDIRKLWTIGQVEEDFTRLVTSCCYHVLENPSIGHVKNRASSEAVTHLLGVAIKRYNHML